MIIGRGLLANALANIDNEKSIFYVNGISNSVISSIPENNFEAEEINEIAKNNQAKIFIYFSTIQVNLEENFDRPYVQHKIRIERQIDKLFPNYTIIRTSNLVGNNSWNKHTLFNFLITL